MSLSGGYIAAVFGYPRLFLIAAILALLSSTLIVGLMSRRSTQTSPDKRGINAG